MPGNTAHDYEVREAINHEEERWQLVEYLKTL